MAKSENKRRTKGEGSLEFNEKKKKWVARITAHRADGSSFRKTFEGKTQKEAKSKRDEYKKVCKRAKIDNVVGLHDLRHTFATKLIRAGVDIKTVSEQLGHSTISFTLKTYVHTVESEKVEKMQALNWA